MNDLLGDVGGAANGTFRDVEAAPPAAAAQDKDIAMFFEEVADIKSIMAAIKRNLHKLQDANEESKLVTRAPQMKAIKEKMEADIKEVSTMAHGIKQRIERIDKSNAESRTKPGCGPGSATDRTRESITGALKKKLKELLADFQSLRQKFQEEYREVVERRYFTVTGEKPSEEVVEHMIETGESENIFKVAIQEQGRGQILDTVAEIQERYNAVKELERGMLEVHQIFLDMAVLVEAQGELLDNIEVQVGKASQHIESGTRQLVQAKNLQRNTRKWMCCAIVILLVVIVIVVVAVVKPWNIGSA